MYVYASFTFMEGAVSTEGSTMEKGKSYVPAGAFDDTKEHDAAAAAGCARHGNASLGCPSLWETRLDLSQGSEFSVRDGWGLPGAEQNARLHLARPLPIQYPQADAMHVITVTLRSCDHLPSYDPLNITRAAKPWVTDWHSLFETKLVYALLIEKERR